MSGLKAVLWDLDGTLVDSEPFWFAAMRALMAHHGLPWTEADHLITVGSHLPDSAAEMQARGLDLPADVIIDQLSDQVSARVVAARPYTPGGLELLAACAGAGLFQGLVTMSYHRMVQPVVAMMRQDVPAVFEVVITGDAVSRGKPLPDPYWQAAAALGVDPANCVAVEDSPTGVASAMAAGMATVAVPGAAQIPAQAGLSRVGTLANLGVEQLRAVQAGQVIDLLAS